MTFDIDAKPESPRLPLFGRVGAYFCLTLADLVFFTQI